MLNFETLNAIWYNGDISYGIIRCQNILAKKKKKQADTSKKQIKLLGGAVLVQVVM